MSSKCFSSMEIDAIGEIMNISLGASATAVSTMLNTRVDITTPIVSVVTKEEFKMEKVEPAVGIEIIYVSGLEGKNVMLLKRHDVKVIVEMLMGMPMSDEEFELNEMNISAICEVMNQMMGASSTALSEFLGKMVNISTPISFEVKNEEEFVDKYFQDDTHKVVVGFNLRIEDKLESEFFNVMPIELAKELVKGLLSEEEIAAAEAASEETASAAPAAEVPEASGSSKTLSQEEIEKLLGNAGAAEEPAPSATGMAGTDPSQQAAPNMGQPVQAAAPEMAQPMQNMAGAAQPVQGTGGMDMSMMQMQMMQQMMQQMQQMQQMQMMAEERSRTPEPKMINVQTASAPTLTIGKGNVSAEVSEENMEMIMGVPLDISVEIGRTKKLVKDILDFTKGSLVVLDKVAGEQVDLFVNGQCIAKGDVVVVEDNFGIRITEILKMNLNLLD